MTLAVDVASTYTHTTTGNPTWSHTCTGAERAIIVGVSFNVADGKTITGVTYAGTALTFVGGVTSVNWRTEQWKLSNPASGANNVVVTFSGTATNYSVSGAVSFTGAHQTTASLTGTQATASGTTADPSVAVSSATGEIVVDTMAWEGEVATYTVGAGQTQRWNAAAVNVVEGAASTEAGAGSVTMSWTGGAARWALAGVGVKPSGPTVYNVSSTDSLIMSEPVTKDRTHNELDKFLFADQSLRQKTYTREAPEGFYINDLVLFGTNNVRLSQDGLFFRDSSLFGYEPVYRSGLFFSDASSVSVISSAQPRYSISMELETGSFTDVTSDCLQFTVTRMMADADTPLSVGRGAFIFDNHAKKFSPQNAAGPFYDRLIHNKKVRVQATHAASVHPIFVGYISKISLEPAVGRRTAVIEADDLTAKLQERSITSSVYADLNVSSAVTVVLSLSGVSSSNGLVARIDNTDSTEQFSFYWARDRKVNASLSEIAKFGQYAMFVNREGKFVFINRTGLVTPVVTTYSTYFGFDYSYDDEDIRNQIKLTAQPRRLLTGVQTVAYLTEFISIPASSGVGVWLTYVDPAAINETAPATGLQTVVSSSDYTLGTTAASGSSDLTATASIQVTFFGETAICSVFNGSGTNGYITKLQLRGSSLQKQPMLSARTFDNSSQNVYGERNYTQEDELHASYPYMSGLAEFMLQNYKNPVPDVRISLKNQFPDCLIRELADIVQVTEDNTAVSTTFLIREIEHSVSLERGLEHTMTLGLRGRLQQQYFTLDHQLFGVLDNEIYRLGL